MYTFIHKLRETPIK